MAQRKKWKLPNRYGSITEMKGKNLRKPFRVRVRSEEIYTDDGRQKWINIGFAESYQEALQMLAEYHKNPNIISSHMTFEEVYEKWSADKFSSISESNIKAYKNAYALCSKLYKKKMVDIKLDDLELVAKESGKNRPSLKKLKTLFSQMFEWATVHDVITKDQNKVEYLDISFAGNPNRRNKSPFTKKERDRLWEVAPGNIYVKFILILIYCGARIGSMLELKKENINLEERWFDIVGIESPDGESMISKTAAGVRRVPIAEKVYPFWVEIMNLHPESEYFITTPDGNPLSYANYRDSYFDNIMEMLRMNHTPHDARHTCISMLDSAGVNKTTIKMIVGHKGKMDLTERVYTHKEMDELLTAINSI